MHSRAMIKSLVVVLAVACVAAAARGKAPEAQRPVTAAQQFSLDAGDVNGVSGRAEGRGGQGRGDGLTACLLQVALGGLFVMGECGQCGCEGSVEEIAVASCGRLRDKKAKE